MSSSSRKQAHVEGAARLANDGDTFFNVKQCLQRDLTILALRVVARNDGPLTLLDALSGSGTRALRSLLETRRGTVRLAVASDIAEGAVRDIVASAALSGLQRVEAATGNLTDRLRSASQELHSFSVPARAGGRSSSLVVLRGNAHALMMALPSTFDVVELDPCGSVGELLAPAVRTLKLSGLLCATATDMGTLSGRFGGENACMTRYGAAPLASAQHQSVEIAVRILLGAVARAAQAAGRAVVPLLSSGLPTFMCGSS